MEGVGKYSDADGLYPADGTTNGNLDTPYTYEQVSYVDYAEGIYIGYKWYETADAEATGMPRATSTAPAMMPLCSYPFGLRPEATPALIGKSRMPPPTAAP